MQVDTREMSWTFKVALSVYALVFIIFRVLEVNVLKANYDQIY